MKVFVWVGVVATVFSLAHVGTAASEVRADTGRRPPPAGAAQLDPDALIPSWFHITGAQPPTGRALAAEARAERKGAQSRGVYAPRPRESFPTQYETPWVTTTPRVQGNNDCWAFVTAEVMESAYYRAAGSVNGALRFAPQALVDCNPYDDTAESGGWWSFVVYQATNGRSGGPLSTNYPYVGTTQSCRVFVPPLYLNIIAWIIADNGTYATEAGIKNALMSKGAVGTAIVSTGKFLNWYGHTDVFTQYQNYRPDCPATNTCGEFNHVVLIVGWDDHRGAWRIRNTWGTNWGDGGYAWVRYGENGIGYSAVWAEMSPSAVGGGNGARNLNR